MRVVFATLLTLVLAVADVTALSLRAASRSTSQSHNRSAGQPLASREVAASDVVSFVISKCGQLSSPICDPEHLLSQQSRVQYAKDLQGLAALDLESWQPGVAAHLVLLNLPGGLNKKVLAAAASELRAQLGDKNNTVIGVFSWRDEAIAISAAPEMEQRLRLHTVERHIEQSCIGVLESIPEEVTSTFIDQLGGGQANPTASQSKRPWRLRITLPQVIELAVYCASCGIGMLVTALVVCFAYDLIVRWHQVARFRDCVKKVQRIHAASAVPKGDPSLCLCCVEDLKSDSTSTVVFLCGHRFHVNCANSWFVEQHAVAGKCPICEEQIRAQWWFCRGVPHKLCDCEASKLESGAVEGAGAAEADPYVQDETKLFVLQSLRKQYPEIISEEFVKNWATCHTEVWLSEMSSPRQLVQARPLLSLKTRWWPWRSQSPTS